MEICYYKHIHELVLPLPDSWSNWNLEVLVFERRRKQEYPEKNLSEKRREPTTNSTQPTCLRQRQDLNAGHISVRRVLSQLRHPLFPNEKASLPISDVVYTQTIGRY